MGVGGGQRQSLAEQVARGKVSPVYCLYGQDDYRREYAVEELLGALLPEGARALNLDQIRAGEGPSGSILGSARTLPFLSTRRVVLLRSDQTLSQHEQEELLTYLEDPSPTTCLVVAVARIDLRTKLAAVLKKKGVLLRFDRLEPTLMEDPLREAAQARGKRISIDAISLLIALAGDDLRQAISGVEKAALFVGDREEIGAQDIEALVGDTRVRSIFQLTDAVSTRDLEGALRFLTSLLENGEEPLPILGMLARQIRLLLRVKVLQERDATPSEMTRTVGLPPRVAAILAQQAVSFSCEQLIASLRNLYLADVAIKTGRIAAPAALHRLVWKLCEA